MKEKERIKSKFVKIKEHKRMLRWRGNNFKYVHTWKEGKESLIKKNDDNNKPTIIKKKKKKKKKTYKYEINDLTLILDCLEADIWWDEISKKSDQI